VLFTGLDLPSGLFTSGAKEFRLGMRSWVFRQQDACAFSAARMRRKEKKLTTGWGRKEVVSLLSAIAEEKSVEIRWCTCPRTLLASRV
jgi:hypothetical protein